MPLNLELVNRGSSELTAAFDYPNDTTLTVASASGWPASTVIVVQEGSTWVMQWYGSRDGNVLQDLSNPIPVYESSPELEHEFSIGSYVGIPQAADILKLVADAVDAVADAVDAHEGEGESHVFTDQAHDEFVLDLDGATGGTYLLGNATVGWTDPLAHDADADAIQTALRTLYDNNDIVVEDGDDFTIMFPVEIGQSGLELDDSLTGNGIEPVLIPAEQNDFVEVQYKLVVDQGEGFMEVVTA